MFRRRQMSIASPVEKWTSNWMKSVALFFKYVHSVFPSLYSCPLIFVIRILHIQYASIEQKKNGIQRDYPIHCRICHLQASNQTILRIPTIISRLLRLALCFDLLPVDDWRANQYTKVIYYLLMMMANWLTRPFWNWPMHVQCAMCTKQMNWKTKILFSIIIHHDKGL